MFTFIAPDGEDFVSGDKIMLPVIFFFLCVFFSLPVIPIVKCGGMQKCSRLISSGYSTFLSVFYTIVFIWTASINTARFSLFIGSVMFGSENRILMISVFLISCIYAAVKGIEAIGRTSSILFFLLFLSLLFVAVNVGEKFDPTEIIPPFYNGFSPVLSAAFHSVTRTLEAVSLMFMCDKINGKYLVTSLSGLALFSLIASVLFLLIVGVTGAFGDTQMFQLYTLTTISEFGTFERLDTVIIGFWTLCAFIKSAFFIYLAVNTLENTFSFKANKLCFCCIGAAVLIITLAISFSSTTFSRIISSRFYESVFVISVTVIPLLTYILLKIKTGKRISKA